MIFLLSGLGILMIGASVVTVYAAVTAKDGCEDELGFHTITHRDASNAGRKQTMDGTLPPLAAAR